MGDLELIIRDELEIPDDVEDVQFWCIENGYDYCTELIGAALYMKGDM